MVTGNPSQVTPNLHVHSPYFLLAMDCALLSLVAFAFTLVALVAAVMAQLHWGML